MRHPGDQRGTFGVYCRWWDLDPEDAERLLRERFDGAIMMGAPWVDHDPRRILAAIVRSG